MIPPDDPDKVLELIRNMTSYYQTALDSFSEDDLYYEGLLDDVIEVPEGFDISIPTTARAIIDEAVDNVEPYDMNIRYAPRGFGQQAQKDAEDVSRWLKNQWEHWRQKNSDIDVIRDFQKNLFKHGKAIFKITIDQTLWPSISEDEEAELRGQGKDALMERVELIKKIRRQNSPIVCRSMSPKYVFEDPSMDARKLWIVEKYDASIEDVRNRFARYDEDIQQPISHDIPIKEYWSATWVDWNGRIHNGKHMIWLNETLVENEDNPYHDIPYVVKHSGFGTDSFEGKPELKATGFFTRQVKSMLRAEIRRVTHFDALMQQLAFPIMLLTNELEEQDWDTSPGAVNYVPIEVLEQAGNIFLQAQLPAPEYMQSINMIQNQIERGTTQRAIRGAGVPGTDSAAQLAMITSQAKLRIEPIKRATEEAVDMVNALALRFIDEILNEPVSVFAAEPTGPDQYTLKPSQIKGRYRTRTTFMPNEDQVKERKLVLITDAMSKAGLNPYDALVFAGWDNPMEVIERNLAYSIMQEPAIKRQLAKQAAKDWGIDPMEMELEELNESSFIQQMVAQLQQNMAGMGQGQPGSPLAQQEGSGPQGGSGQGASNSAPPPQQIGHPLAMPNQMPSVNDARREVGQISG